MDTYFMFGKYQNGSVKDASTQSVVPRDPGGRPMGHHRGEVEL